MDKENTRKGPNQQNYQETHTIIVNGVKYTNVPEKTRKEIEKNNQNVWHTKKIKQLKVATSKQKSVEPSEGSA